MSPKPAAGPQSAHVALLRGVNVGGKRLLPMKELAALFVAAGCEGVRTYIQSGNVVFSAPPAVLDGLAERIEEGIKERFGFHSPVVLRTAPELARVLRDNPFLLAGEPEKSLHVMFLAARPTAQAIGKLDANRSPADAFRVVDREIYLHLPNGSADTKLTNAYFDAALATTGTARNWTTVRKLSEMLQG